jgi:hypothetical protein
MAFGPPMVLAPGFLRKRWPGPDGLGSLAVPLAVLAGALGFAVFVPLSRTGIGWFLGGLVAVVAVIVAAKRGAPNVRRVDNVIRLLWAAASLALLSVLTFRNAWWLVTFCVLAALVCATLAAVGGRSIRSMAFGLVAAPFAALRSLPWVGRHLDSVRSEGAKPGVAKRLIWSVVSTVVLLLVFGALFASADAAFSELLGRYTPTINGGTVFVWVFLFVVGALTTTASLYLVSAPPDLSGMDTPSKNRLGRVEWALPVAALVILFSGFVVVQVAVLFGGRRHVLATAGLSYADYAKSGFWQLVTVTILTLLIISGVARWAARETPADRLVLRILLGLLSALSIVVVASALFRMNTYQQAYSFTGERIFVMGFELVLGSIFVLILLSGIQLRGEWIPRAVVGLGVALLLGLAVLNPEAYAAQRNIDRFQTTRQIDPWYLRALSADATPVLATLPDDLRRCTLEWISPELLEQSDPWYAWNLGRQQAREILNELGPIPAGTCVLVGPRYDFPKTR